MANPNIKDYTKQYEWQHGVLLPTADTFINLLANSANDGRVILFDLWANSRDTSADYGFAWDLCSTVGVPMFNHTGVTGTASTGTTVGTNVNCGPVSLPIVARLANQIIRRGVLNEGMSLAVKPVGASSNNKIGVTVRWSVISLV